MRLALILPCLFTIVYSSFIQRFHLLGSSDSNVEECSAVDQLQVRHCLEGYFGGFGYNASETLPPYVQFDMDTKGLLVQYETGGIDRICGNFQSFEDCNKDYTNTTCLSRRSFQSMFNVSFEEAELYSVDFPTRDYECVHKKVLYDNFPCFKSVYQHDSTGVEKCISRVESMIANGDNACIAMNEYVACTAPLYGACGNSELRPYVCTVLQMGVPPGYCTGKMPDCNSSPETLPVLPLTLASVVAMLLK